MRVRDIRSLNVHLSASTLLLLLQSIGFVAIAADGRSHSPRELQWVSRRYKSRAPTTRSRSCSTRVSESSRWSKVWSASCDSHRTSTWQLTHPCMHAAPVV